MSEQASEWPKVASTWTHDGRVWRVDQWSSGRMELVEETGFDDAHESALCARIAALESEKATAQRERDEALKDVQDLKAKYVADFVRKPSGRAPAPERQDGDDTAKVNAWMRVADEQEQRAIRAEVALQEATAKRQDGERPDRDGGAEYEKVGPCFACWVMSDGELRTGQLVDVCAHGCAHREVAFGCLCAIECARCGARGPSCFRSQDPAKQWNALFARLSPPLTARSSDAAVSVDVIARAIHRVEAGYDEPPCPKCVETAKGVAALLPARSSAEGEALDRIEAAHKAFSGDGRCNWTVLHRDVGDALRASGRLGGAT